MIILNDKKDYNGLSLGGNIITDLRTRLIERGFDYTARELKVGCASMVLREAKNLVSTGDNISLYNELSVLEELAFKVSYDKEKRTVYVKKIKEFLSKYKVNKKSFYKFINCKIKISLNLLKCELIEKETESEEKEIKLNQFYEKDFILEDEYTEAYFKLYDELLKGNKISSYRVVN